MFCTVLEQSELVLPSSNFRSQPFNHKTKPRWNRRHYLIVTAAWLCLADWHLLALYWNSSAQRKQESHTWTGGVIMKLTLVSHLGSLENKGSVREVDCLNPFTMQVTHVERRPGEYSEDLSKEGASLHGWVRSICGEIWCGRHGTTTRSGPHSWDSSWSISTLLKNYRRQPAPEAEAVLEMRSCTAVCHDGETSRHGCTSCSSLKSGMQIPLLPPALAKDLFTFPHRCDKKSNKPNQTQNPPYLGSVSAI